MEDLFIKHLRERLNGQLPGRAAQLKMAALKRLIELGDRLQPPPDAKVACVLNLLHRQGDEWHTVLIQRTSNPHDRHSGQISFPGGRYESSDGSLEMVALREAEEEIGTPVGSIQVIGRLTELYIPISNFLVHPFVGVLQGEAAFVPQPGEVASILTPPLSLLRRPDIRKRTHLSTATGIQLEDVPYFDVEGNIVWGATAMILSEFFDLFD